MEGPARICCFLRVPFEHQKDTENTQKPSQPPNKNHCSQKVLKTMKNNPKKTSKGISLKKCREYISKRQRERHFQQASRRCFASQLAAHYEQLLVLALRAWRGATAQARASARAERLVLSLDSFCFVLLSCLFGRGAGVPRACGLGLVDAREGVNPGLTSRGS